MQSMSPSAAFCLKGNSTNFPHKSVFTGLGEYVGEKEVYMYFVAPEEAVCSLTNFL